MQFAKDSVYVALRDRLAAINPERVAVLGGVSRPAITVRENQPVNLQNDPALLQDIFELEWGTAQLAGEPQSPGRPLMKIDLQISYRVAGSSAGRSDRGRVMTAMDAELLQMCTPRRTEKLDYTEATPVPLGSFVFWSDPQFGALKEAGDGVLRRTVYLSIFFYPEVEAA